MIRLFGATDKAYVTNGDAILKPIVATVRLEDNGAYTLDLETDLSYSALMIQDAIVVVPTLDGDQPFRIVNPVKTGRRIITKAKHVSYDSETLLIADSYVVNKDGAGALAWLNAATDTTSPFTTSSDVSRVDSFRCVRKSLWEALQTVLERWGGHLVRSGWSIGLQASLEKDNGATIRTGKNLSELTWSEDWSEVVTKLLPVGKDGILLNAVNQSASIYVTGTVSYDRPYTRTLSFDQNEIDPEDYQTEAAYKAALVADLQAKAEAYVAAHQVPAVNYTLEASLDHVDGIGNVIKVQDTRLGLELQTQVTAYEYDCIRQRITSLEFGNHKRTLSGLIPDIAKRAKEV